jgi:CPA1 family monovalent cation:H+ antiporter
LGGVAVGLAMGYAIRWVRKRLDDPPTEITISLVSGYAAYIPAEELGLSGVIAAVTIGLYMGWYSAELTTATTRMQGQGAWEVLTFLLNAVLFILVGLQFPGLVRDLDGFSAGELVLYAVIVSLTVILIRLAWVFFIAEALPRLFPSRYEDDPTPPWRVTFLVAWSAMRGAVALAAALAIPTTIDGGAAFPERDLIIFLTYAVILATLVVQGLTLGPVISLLRLRSDGLDEQEEVFARARMAEAGIARIDALAQDGWVPDETAERTRALRDFRRRRFVARMDGDDSIDERSQRYQRFMHEVIRAEREALVHMRNAGEITDDVRRTVERDLDLEEARLS